MPAVELPVVFNAEYIGVHRSLGPSFSSPVIRSIIFQVLHFPAIEKFWFVIFWSCKFSAPSWWRRKNRQVKPKLKESKLQNGMLFVAGHVAEGANIGTTFTVDLSHVHSSATDQRDRRRGRRRTRQRGRARGVELARDTDGRQTSSELSVAVVVR